MKTASRGSFWAWFWMSLGVLYFFVPLYATFDFSLRAKKDELSLLAYESIFQDPKFLGSVRVVEDPLRAGFNVAMQWGSFTLRLTLNGQTLIIAPGSFIFSVVIGVFTIFFGLLLVVPTAYWVRLKLPFLRPYVEFVTLMPFVIPAVVLVFGLIRVYSGGPFYLTNTPLGTNFLLIAGYLVLAIPYLYSAVDTGLQAIDVRSLTEAAQSLGAGWGTILFRVIFPNLRVSMLSGAFLTMATVIGEFTIASFLVGLNAFGPYMSQMGQNKAYEPSAMAIVTFGLTWMLMMIIQWLGQRAPGNTQTVGVR